MRSESGLFIFHVTDRNSYNVFKLPIQSRKYITSQTVKNLKQTSLQFIKKNVCYSPIYMTKHKTSQLHTLRGSSTDFQENILTDIWAEKNSYLQSVRTAKKKEGMRQTD